MLKHIFMRFFVWKFEGQNKNFLMIGAPFIGVGTVGKLEERCADRVKLYTKED